MERARELGDRYAWSARTKGGAEGGRRAKPTQEGPRDDDHKRRRGNQHRRGGGRGGPGCRDRGCGYAVAGRHLATVGEFFSGPNGSARGTRGVSVEVGEEQAAVGLTVSVPYGRSIPEVTQAMRDNVIRRVDKLTGLEVTEVNTTVKDVFLPEQ